MSSSIKTLFILCMLFALFTRQSNGQPYHPFQSDSATWTIVEYGYVIPVQTGVWHFGMDGDTVINALSYKKLYCNGGSLGFINPEPVFNRQTAFLFAMFREDSLKRVWFRPDTVDILYYDFSLNVGDTFCFDYQPCGINCHPVSAVDSILINGSYRRQIHFSYGGQEETWIEGIGSAFDNWIGSWCYIGNIAWELNCYSEAGNHVYGPCNYPTGVAETSNPALSFHVYPDPIHDFFFVRGNTTPDKLIVTNALGQIILSFKPGEFRGDLELDASGWDSGVYFITLQSGNSVITKKAIKIN